MTTITYPKTVAAALKGAECLLVLAPEKAVKGGWQKAALPKTAAEAVAALKKGAKAGTKGWAGSTLLKGALRRVVLGLLPDERSRHNCPARTEEILACTRKAGLPAGGKAVVACVEDPTHLTAVLAGVWRAFPHFSSKTTGSKKKPAPLAFVAVDRKGKPIPIDKTARARVEAGRWAAEMVDTPTAELTTAEFAKRARKFVAGMPRVTSRVITTDGLLKEKLLGIHSVGRAAVVGPRMLILDYRPAAAKRTFALVGKGVVYDTGGLSLKISGFMRTMKCDMAGAAAVVGAFKVLASTGCKDRVIALAPLAENSIGPSSYRPDDIVKMHSGLTVEIDNTDAEGRLLLGDAVSYAGRKFNPDAIIDIATLTGAQLIATGRRHGALVSNREGFEHKAFAAGRMTGDLAWPLPFAPEFFQEEFKSVVADMKNSVKDRSNAQSSCAAQFVYEHIKDLDIPWLHIDVAGPSHRSERGTGYGVGLMSDLVANLKAADLKK